MPKDAETFGDERWKMIRRQMQLTNKKINSLEFDHRQAKHRVSNVVKYPIQHGDWIDLKIDGFKSENC